MKIAQIAIPVALIAGIGVYLTAHAQNGQSPQEFQGCQDSKNWTISRLDDTKTFGSLYCTKTYQKWKISCAVEKDPSNKVSNTRVYIYIAHPLPIPDNWPWRYDSYPLDIPNTKNILIDSTNSLEYCATAYTKVIWSHS